MKVRAGEPFQPSASVWNRMIELTNRHDGRLGRQFKPAILRKYIGKVDGTITAGSDSGGTRTPGSGTVDLYHLDTNDDLAALTDGAGTGYTVTAYNWTTTASGTDAWVIVEQDSLGTWWLTNEAC